MSESIKLGKGAQ